MSPLTLRDVTLRDAVSVTSGGPAALREATTAVTFAEMLDFLPTVADVHRCVPAANGPEQTRVALLPAAGATLDSPVYTLITF